MAHVALYVHDLRSSGVVRNALVYARRLARDHRVTLIAGSSDGLFAESAATEEFALVTLAAGGGRLSRPAAILALRRWLRAARPAVLLSAGNLGHPTVYAATRGMAAPRRIYRISNAVARGDGLRSALRERWMAALVADAAAIALVGAAQAGLPVFARALADGRAVEIANGVDRDDALRLAAAPAPHSWLGGEVPVVLAIGRLRPQKNFDLLIDAVGLARAARRLRLILLGSGTPEEQARLTARAAAAGLGDDFLLAGETDNVFAWLARATVFALPSRWEGSSMALLEALAVGAPVVVSRQAGDAVTVLADGRYGVLADGGDAGAFAAALLAQTGPDPVRPGDRALAYGVSADRYAALVATVLDGGPPDDALANAADRA